MLCRAILAWTLVLPAVWAVFIETNHATLTETVCSTRYGREPVSSLPTGTVRRDVELVPVMLHNSTTLTKTVTPKPFKTYFSQLETSTKWVTRTPINGTFDTTSTIFHTSTDWHHSTLVVTSTAYRYKTSRSTSWIPEPTGFLPIRDTTAADYPGGERKRDLDHPHPGLSARRVAQAKPKCQRPTASSYPVSVRCTEKVETHTTEVMFLTYSKSATSYLSRETSYKTKTVWGTVTSTVLSIPASIAQRDVSSEYPSETTTAASETTNEPSFGPSPEFASETASSTSTTIPEASGSMGDFSTMTTISSTTSTTSTTPIPQSTGSDGIVTRYHRVTSTPYTITFTWTSTSTSTTTSTRHATTTVTSHAACATQNLLTVTSNQQRINGFTPIKGRTSLRKTNVVDATACCETCMEDPLCAYSFYEAEGRDRGSCYVFEVESDGVCYDQKLNQAAYGFRGGNGEVRYVASNGNCGFIGDYDFVFQ